LLIEPRVRVLERHGDVARLRIDGIVCEDLCAVRAARAIRDVEGVRDATIDFEAGVATITGGPADTAAYQRAIERVVVAPGLRRWLARTTRALGRRPHRGAAR